MIYISAPYSHSDPTVVEARMDQVRLYFLGLVASEKHATSPLLIGHELVSRNMCTGSHDFWLAYSESMLKTCSEVHVLCIDGWHQSAGLHFEVEAAKKLNIPILFVSLVQFAPK